MIFLDFIFKCLIIGSRDSRAASLCPPQPEHLIDDAIRVSDAGDGDGAIGDRRKSSFFQHYLLDFRSFILII